MQLFTFSLLGACNMRKNWRSPLIFFKAWFFTCRANLDEKKLPIECLTTQDYSRERTTMTSSIFRRMAKYFYKTREEGFMGELFSQGWAPLVLYMVMSDGSYSWPLEGRVRCVKKKPCCIYVYLASQQLFNIPLSMLNCWLMLE